MPRLTHRDDLGSEEELERGARRMNSLSSTSDGEDVPPPAGSTVAQLVRRYLSDDSVASGSAPRMRSVSPLIRAPPSPTPLSHGSAPAGHTASAPAGTGVASCGLVLLNGPALHGPRPGMVLLNDAAAASSAAASAGSSSSSLPAPATAGASMAVPPAEAAAATAATATSSTAATATPSINVSDAADPTRTETPLTGEAEPPCAEGRGTQTDGSTQATQRTSSTQAGGTTLATQRAASTQTDPVTPDAALADLLHRHDLLAMVERCCIAFEYNDT